jgi:predicted DNA-binding ribbon-helix-helix protein
MTGGGRSSQPPYRKAVTRSMIRAKADSLACGSAAARGRGLTVSLEEQDYRTLSEIALAQDASVSRVMGIERWTADRSSKAKFHHLAGERFLRSQRHSEDA